MANLKIKNLLNEIVASEDVGYSEGRIARPDQVKVCVTCPPMDSDVDMNNTPYGAVPHLTQRPVNGVARAIPNQANCGAGYALSGDASVARNYYVTPAGSPIFDGKVWVYCLYRSTVNGIRSSAFARWAINKPLSQYCVTEDGSMTGDCFVEALTMSVDPDKLNTSNTLF